MKNNERRMRREKKMKKQRREEKRSPMSVPVETKAVRVNER